MFVCPPWDVTSLLASVFPQGDHHGSARSAFSSAFCRVCVMVDGSRQLGRGPQERVHRPSRIDERPSGIDRDSDAQRLGDLLGGGALLPRGMDVRRYAAVTLTRDTNGNRDQLPGLRSELRSLAARVAQL